jgi:type I restriction enzyme R subunit
LKEEMVSGGSGSSVVREDAVSYGGGHSSHAPKLETVLAEAACEMEDIIRKHAVVRWRENIDAQNRMRNDLDDFLYDLQTRKGIEISFSQMDSIIEAAIRIAMHRTDDV